jgi:hypothetical protein
MKGLFSGILFIGSQILHAQHDRQVFEYTYDTIYRTYRGDFTQQSVGGIDLHWKDSTTYVVYNFCGANQLKIIDFQSDSVLELPQADTAKTFPD